MTAKDRARGLLTALTSSLSGDQWQSAHRWLRGEDPDLDRELKELLTGPGFAPQAPAATLTASADATQTVRSPADPEEALDVMGAGHRIGAYEVLRVLGRGGFGVVYLAHRADRLFERQVAIKLMRSGAQSGQVIARFEAERRILAMLQHPHIAQLLDAGTSAAGQPYFVMEYVDGSPLTDYIQEKHLELEDVLRLFLPICQAVDFAHQRLIVHRDLKPSNILVGRDGEVKLLDFGIAKLLDTDIVGDGMMTMPGHQPMTPRYASPEQIRGEPVSTRTDVYALGVVLYEAVAGRAPYEATGMSSLMRAILEEDPPPPTLAAGGRQSKEIDAIVLTALQKDAGRRYSSAGQMGEDIERFLEGRPVRAHGDSRGYRAAKFARRHRTGVLAAGLLLLSLIAGIVSTARQTRVANAERALAQQREKDAVRERQRAEEQAQLARSRQQEAQSRARDVRGIALDLLGDLQETVSTLPGGSAAREQLVSRAIQSLDRLEKDSGGEPELEAEIAFGYRQLGELYETLYRPGNENVVRALESYRQSAARLTRLLAGHPEQPARDTWRVGLAAAAGGAGSALVRLGQTREAQAEFRRALALLSSTEVPAGAEALAVRGDTQMNLALSVWRETARPVEPLRLARQALEWKRAAAAAEPKRTRRWRFLATGQAELGLILAESGDPAAGLRSVEDARASLARALALQPGDFLAQRDVIGLRLMQGNMQQLLGQTEQAATTFEAAVQASSRLLETDPGNLNVRYDMGNAHSWLGDMLARMGKPDSAREHYSILVRVAGELCKSDSKNLDWKEMLHSADLRLGDSYADQNRYPEALPHYRAALAVSEEMVALSKGSPAMLREMAFACQRMGEAALNTNDARGALDWNRKAEELHGRTVRAEPQNVEYLVSLSSARSALGDVERRLRRQGGPEEEIETYRSAVAAGEAALRLRPTSMEVQEYLAGAYVRFGQRSLEKRDMQAAISALESSGDIRRKLSSADPNTPRYRRDLAISLSLLGEAQSLVATPGDAQWKAKSCQSLGSARDLTAALVREGQRINNPLLVEERWTLMKGCTQK